MELNVLDQIKRFQEFIEVNYYDALLDNARKGSRSILIDFAEISKFDPDLATELLDSPEETLKAVEKSIEQFDIEGLANFKVRLYNLPTTEHIMVRDIRSKHINKLVCVQGLIRQKSDVRPQVTSARFECPICGNIMNVLQLDGTFKEPSKCGCGRKGKFIMLDKELVDAQGIVLEEASENLEGGEQPKRFNVLLTGDLVSPLSEKRTSPGSKVEAIGIVKEVPLISKSGAKSTRFDLMIECNYINPTEDTFYEINITPEEEKEILEIANDPKGYEKLVNSMAPSIYGYEKIKESLLLQLMGGVRKVRMDKVVSRGDMHILLVGDPGCIAGGSQVALIYKGMEKIQNLGKEHLQPIREVVTKIRRDGKDKYYDFATLFQHYPKQPVLKVVTETGKEVVCTYNQPFLTKDGWKRADEILLGTEIRVMPKIPTMVKKLALTGFTKVEKKSGHLKDISIPNKFTLELSSLCGYILGDGHISKRGYSIISYVNNEEKDLIEKLSNLWEKTFDTKPAVYVKNVNGSIKTIDDGSGLLRQIVSTQQIYSLEMNSRQISHSLAFLSNKRVPQQIFKSPKHVIAKFISWLFEADGCSFSNGRGRTSIQLKSNTKDLLKDVQLLLLYFGIQSRIIKNNLCIRRSRDIEIFAEHIGFNSEKKIRKLMEVLSDIKSKSSVQKRKSPQRYERIVEIMPAGVMDVYDFEVPVSHTFIANGIVCHNSGKSALLKRITTIAPKGRYVSGKGVSGAGLTAAVVRDEFLKGWALEAGAMVLSSDGLVCVDELDKMSNEDRAAMHEALENQSYHPDTEIMFSDGSVSKIGEFVNNLIESNKTRIIFGKDCEMLPVNDIELLTTDFKKIFPIKAKMVSRHKSPDYFIKITYSNGRSITVTPEHPIFVFSDKGIQDIPAENVKESMLAPAPRKLPTKTKKMTLSNEWLNHFNNKEINLQSHLNNGFARLLGFITTEGHAYHNQENRYAEVGISNTNPLVIDDVSTLFKETFQTTINLNTQLAHSRLKATKDLTTVRLCSIPFYNYMFYNFKGSVNGARNKYVDNILRCSDKDLQLEFLKSAFKGDGFVDSTRFGYSTSSSKLAEGYQDLLLQNNIASRIDTESRNATEYYKVSITGRESFRLFVDSIVEKDDSRLARIIKFYNTSKNKRNERDILPKEILMEVDALLKNFGLSDGYFHTNIKRGFNAHRDVVLDYLKKIENKIKRSTEEIKNRDTKKIRKLLNVEVNLIAKNLNVSTGTIYYIEKLQDSDRYNNLLKVIKRLGKEKINKSKYKINNILRLINSEIRFLYVKKVEKIKNENIEWVYDVTIEPTRTFISEGLVLHNTVSISKANIQATLIARTTVLAAANPKFGRFDPYGIIADQIDLPPTLINRFDLIFPIKDLPEEIRDEKMAKHILTLHQSPDVNEPEISTNVLRKYIAYARQKVNPKLTDGALEEIKDFYLKMRKSGSGESGIKAVPISARQLEALVRLSEASARSRLDDRVTRKDAKKAVELLDYCLMEVGFDRETGKIDIDRIATGIPSTARSHILILKDIIGELETKLGKTIPIEDVVAEAKTRGLDEDKIEEALERLKRSGDVYEPRRGFIGKL